MSVRYFKMDHLMDGLTNRGDYLGPVPMNPGLKFDLKWESFSISYQLAYNFHFVLSIGTNTPSKVHNCHMAKAVFLVSDTITEWACMPAKRAYTPCFYFNKTWQISGYHFKIVKFSNPEIHRIHGLLER